MWLPEKERERALKPRDYILEARCARTLMALGLATALGDSRMMQRSPSARIATVSAIHGRPSAADAPCSLDPHPQKSMLQGTRRNYLSLITLR